MIAEAPKTGSNKIRKEKRIISFFQTTSANIYAIGDIINHINLTPVAIKQAVVVANHLFNNKSLTLNYQNLPTAVFSQPNLATVGLTEEEAEKQGEVEIFKATPTPIIYSIINP